MTERPAVVSIDANVILRYVLQDHRSLSEKATKIMKAVESGRARVICDPVNIAEVIWVLSSFYGLDNAEIAKGLLPIINADNFMLPDKDRYLLAFQLFIGLVPHFGDACACATALLECEGRLYSFDTDLTHVKGIARFDTPVVI
jgi:predicted nucleic acid-binding protein